MTQLEIIDKQEKKGIPYFNQQLDMYLMYKMEK